MKIVFLSLLFGLTATTIGYGQCPTLEVTSPAGTVLAGSVMQFRVRVGMIGPGLGYRWTVISQGTIVSGQGTDEIMVATDLGDGNVTATVEVDGLPHGCENKVSQTVPLAICFLPVLIDEWAKLKPNDQRGRLDTFFAELGNNPDNVGVFVLLVTNDELLGPGNGNIKFILKHARFRKFDKDRFVFALEKGDEHRVKLYRLSPDGEVPCAGCMIIKGRDL